MNEKSEKWKTIRIIIILIAVALALYILFFADFSSGLGGKLIGLLPGGIGASSGILGAIIGRSRNGRERENSNVKRGIDSLGEGLEELRRISDQSLQGIRNLQGELGERGADSARAAESVINDLRSSRGNNTGESADPPGKPDNEMGDNSSDTMGNS